MRITGAHLDALCRCGRPHGTHSLTEYVEHAEAAPVALSPEEVAALRWAVAVARTVGVRVHAQALASAREKLAGIDARCGR